MFLLSTRAAKIPFVLSAVMRLAEIEEEEESLYTKTRNEEEKGRRRDKHGRERDRRVAFSLIRHTRAVALWAEILQS